jgi:hypothetical protein
MVTGKINIITINLSTVNIDMALKTNYLMDEPWDFLIILDACRFDYFKKSYKNYFEGNLEKRRSLGTCTPEWCNKTFTDQYPNVIYISGNPYINSKVKIKRFEGKKHFNKIIDVWGTNWEPDLGTVLPDSINNSVVENLNKYGDKKFIIHYLQPHAPYLSPKFKSTGFTVPDVDGSRRVLNSIQGRKSNRALEAMVKAIGIILLKLRIINNIWDLRLKFRLPPATPMDEFRQKWGVKGLREAYNENVNIILEHVAELCSVIQKKYRSRTIVITSDHGEMLGEDGKFSHRTGSKNPILFEVPYFIVTRSKVKEIIPPAGETKKLKSSITKLKRSGKI